MFQIVLISPLAAFSLLLAVAGCSPSRSGARSTELTDVLLVCSVRSAGPNATDATARSSADSIRRVGNPESAVVFVQFQGGLIERVDAGWPNGPATTGWADDGVTLSCYPESYPSTGEMVPTDRVHATPLGLGSPEYPGPLVSPNPLAVLDAAGPSFSEADAPRGVDYYEFVERGRCARLWAHLCEVPGQIRGDYCAFYSWPGMRDLLLGVAAGSVLANSSLDQDFRDWYQQRVRTQSLDETSRFWKTFGEGTIVMPSCVGLAAVGAMFDDQAWGTVLGEFGSRASRSYLVGSPPMLLGQGLLGSARPGPGMGRSYWQPFKAYHGISGHAFVGAVPFITAAQMADEPLLKGGFYCLSALTAWTRIDCDMHYLSQALLGWWFAYLACRAVDEAGLPEKPYSISPVVAPDLVGVGVTYRR